MFSFRQLVLDSQKRVFSWGFGGYGRLGHAEQKDEMVPRLVKLFDFPGRGASQIYAGYTCSFAVSEVGQWFLHPGLGRKVPRTMFGRPSLAVLWREPRSHHQCSQDPEPGFHWPLPSVLSNRTQPFVVPRAEHLA